MNLHKSIPALELRASAQGIVEGYASTFGGRDSYGDSVAPGAFSTSLSKHAAARTAPVMLWAHAQASPVGRWEHLSEDSRGLQVAGRLNLKTTAGQQAFEHLSAGDIAGLSIGYAIPPGGSEFKAGVNLLKQIDLHEISLVALPADSQARITSVKAHHSIELPTTLREFESALRELGFSRREAAQIASKGFGAIDEASDLTPDLAAAHAALLSLTSMLKGTS